MDGQKRRGGPGGRGGSRPSHPRVPPSRAINPGTSVNIILKADQPTGRTVPGRVSELLTRGDHPRGVKVRLTDGRVGRVQSLRSGEPTQEIDGGAEGAQESAPEGDNLNGRGNRFTSPEIRHDGLDMYIRPAKGKKKSKKTQAGRNEQLGERLEDTGGATQLPSSLKCPVCADFEGDEAAVAHHVGGHFGE
ncbi:unnamed protein product [Penicillium glandicola]